MTDEAKALVDGLRALHVWPQAVADGYADLLTPRQIEKLYEVGRVSHEAADQIETQAREIERLRLDVEAQEALQVSAYHAGLRAGWNFGVSDDNAGMQAAMADTAHIKELRRIREARAALAGDSHDQ